jgi:hypothetical protein
MMFKLIRSKEFIHTLYQIDMDFFLQAKQNPCSHCGGKLDQSNYLRKPRGSDDIGMRFSLCCREEGCRKRVMPPSVRFFKGFVYHAAIILVIAYFLNPSISRRNRLSKVFGVSPRTIKRWIIYWKKVFPNSKLDKVLKGQLSAPGYSLKLLFGSSLSLTEILKLFKDSFILT